MRKMPPSIALANRAGDSRMKSIFVPCGAVLVGAGTAPVLEARHLADVLQAGAIEQRAQRIAVGRVVEVADDGDVVVFLLELLVDVGRALRLASSTILG